MGSGFSVTSSTRCLSTFLSWTELTVAHMRKTSQGKAGGRISARA